MDGTSASDSDLPSALGVAGPETIAFVVGLSMSRSVWLPAGGGFLLFFTPFTCCWRFANYLGFRGDHIPRTLVFLGHVRL